MGVDKKDDAPKYRLNPFADARLGKSLFEMQPEDWLEREQQK